MSTEPITPSRPVTFLLVDDLESNLLALSGLLKRDGVNLVLARSGAEALEILLVQDVALAFLDVQMPGMDGFELAELMRGTARTRRVPIIFLTAGAIDLQRRFRGYELGAVDFLFKPIEPHILQGKAAVFFELARQRDELETARKKLANHAADLERTVAERTSKLRETVQELEAFSYSIAHDLRAPLRGMKSFAQILLDEHAGEMDTPGRAIVQRIGNAASRMDALIRDVLSYTHVLRTNARLVPVELDRLVRDVVAAYPDWQPPKVCIQIQGTLPPVMGHEGFLTQCVSNLLGNAIKFVAPGSTPRILLRAEQRSDSPAPVVRLWVEDNGIGIAPKDRERVFRMFERIHPAEQFEGTGIGLTIVRKAVDRMGGKIGFESEIGQGTKFWVDLQGARSEGADTTPA